VLYLPIIVLYLPNIVLNLPNSMSYKPHIAFSSFKHRTKSLKDKFKIKLNFKNLKS